MSRTYNTRPSRISYPEDSSSFGTEKIPYTVHYVSAYGDGESCDYTCYWYKQIPGSRTKKKRHVDTESHWMTTPQWWVRLYMNQPLRAKGRVWEHNIIRCKIDTLIDIDIPGVSRKPHDYYW